MIPPGKVTTYGDVARFAGLPGYARYVGHCLASLPQGTRLPWHRVVNARLEISRRADGAGLQRQRLAHERVTFSGRRIDGRHRWRPDEPQPEA